MVEAIGLTPYAVEFRYPESADKEISQKELKNALEIAENVLKSINSLIK
jgi:DNA-binding Xre family transcriptional regulator